MTEVVSPASLMDPEMMFQPESDQMSPVEPKSPPLDLIDTGKGLKVQTATPHLVSLGSGRLSVAITLLPLKEGKTHTHTQTLAHMDTYLQLTSWVRITGSYCNHPSSHHFSVPRTTELFSGHETFTAFNPLPSFSLLHLSLLLFAPPSYSFILSKPMKLVPIESLRKGYWNKEFLLLSYKV